jgi:hypothetical protein
METWQFEALSMAFKKLDSQNRTIVKLIAALSDRMDSHDLRMRGKIDRCQAKVTARDVKQSKIVKKLLMEFARESESDKAAKESFKYTKQ